MKTKLRHNLQSWCTIIWMLIRYGFNLDKCEEVLDEKHIREKRKMWRLTHGRKVKRRSKV